jgi:4-oxalocrotonate tautomerase
MPFLNLKIAPLQNPEQYTAISRRLAAITAEILDKRSEVTAIAIDDLPAARWSIGGEPPARPTAMLEISITTGTNTAEQKERFIAAAFAALERALAAGGPLEAASYVVVRELPAGDWGYGGRTQLARRLEREREQAAA